MAPTASVRAARWLAAPAVAAVLVAGVWVTGGLITDSFRASMALTAAWFVAAAVACLAIARARRSLRVPVLGGYAVAAVAVGGYLGYSTLHDRVVHERVVVGTPASRLADRAAPTAVRARANVEVASGSFRAGEHATSGVARVVRLAGGRRVLTLTRFATAAGPDLRVRLAPGATTDGGAAGVVDLGALKGNRGSQQYDLHRGAPTRHATVLIWCRAFSALFGAAALRPA
jgi:Electron transfer DM13